MISVADDWQFRQNPQNQETRKRRLDIDLLCLQGLQPRVKDQDPKRQTPKNSHQNGTSQYSKVLGY